VNTPNSNSTFGLFVGVDIAARSFSVALLLPTKPPQKALDYPQSAQGYASFLQHLQHTHSNPSQIRVVMEATGTYWVTLATVLHQAGMVVCPVNPKQAHHFFQALPRRAKNDQLDAQGLAQLAQALEPISWNPPPEIYYQLQQRLAQRQSLLDLRQQVKNQLHSLSALPMQVPEVVGRMQALIVTFEHQLSQVQKEVEELVEQEGEWQKSIVLLTSIPGFGLLTACLVVVYTLNFGLCNSVEAATHYAGLAPMERTSGTSVSGRSQLGHFGHTRLRTTLYLASLSAGQHNPVVKVFYERLKQAGKPAKVARCAAARKLLHLAYGVVKSGKVFDPEYTTNSRAVKAA